MNSATGTEQEFQPYLVEGGRNSENIFRVMNPDREVSQKNMTTLLRRIPVSFSVRSKASIKNGAMGEEINEPLEVYFDSQIISIYPPKSRVVTCIAMAPPYESRAVSKIHVDNLVDLLYPGRGQLRSCIHFNPEILGITDWPADEIEVDMHAYPKGEEEKVRIEPYIFGKREVLKLLDTIAEGEEGPTGLTAHKIKGLKDLIMYAVECMRSQYENPDIAEDYPVRVYYKNDWPKIFSAKNDKELANALDDLRTSIRHE